MCGAWLPSAETNVEENRINVAASLRFAGNVLGIFWITYKW